MTEDRLPIDLYDGNVSALRVLLKKGRHFKWEVEYYETYYIKYLNAGTSIKYYDNLLRTTERDELEIPHNWDVRSYDSIPLDFVTIQDRIHYSPSEDLYMVQIDKDDHCIIDYNRQYIGRWSK